MLVFLESTAESGIADPRSMHTPLPPAPLDKARCLSKLVVSIYFLTGVFLGSMSGHSQPIVGIAKLQVLSCSLNCETLAYRQSRMFSESPRLAGLLRGTENLEVGVLRSWLPPSRTVLAGTGLNSTIVGQAVMLQRFGDDPCVLEGLLEGTGTLTNE